MSAEGFSTPALPYSNGRSADFPTTRGLDRREFFGGLLLAGCINGLAARIVEAVSSLGWENAFLSTFNVSAIVWISCVSGLALVMQERLGETRRLDFLVAAVFLIFVALPLTNLSWGAVAGLSAYLFATAGRSAAKQGAAILLAVTVPMLWSRLLFSFFASPILNADAVLVSRITGTSRAGNIVEFADHSGDLVILAPCSSLANVSLAMLCWVTVSELVGHRRAIPDIFWCLLACASVVAINVFRMAMMGRSEALYHAIHSPFSEAVTSWLIAATTISICLLGVRRDLFARV